MTTPRSSSWSTRPARSLARWLEPRSRRTWPEILARFRAAGRGLDAAHKPRRSSTATSRPTTSSWTTYVGAVLGDFGLAFGLDEVRTAAAETRGPLPRRDHRSALLRQPLTAERPVSWAPSGTSRPEALSGRATHRSDQYSLCVALFHALFGVLARARRTSAHRCDPATNPPSGADAGAPPRPVDATPRPASP
jgi:hypothetical protein